MKSSTHTLELAASKEKAFDFLSRIENLPQWARQFCRSMRVDAAGRTKIETPQGEIYFEIRADAPTGMIDMYGGPDEAHMAYWPARVVERPGAGSLFIFSAFQYPGVSDDDFARQCDGLQQEFPHIVAATQP